MSPVLAIVVLAVYLVGVYLAFIIAGFVVEENRSDFYDTFYPCILWPVVAGSLLAFCCTLLAQNLARRTRTALPAIPRLLGILSLPLRPYALGMALRCLYRRKKNPGGGGATETESPEGSASQ